MVIKSLLGWMRSFWKMFLFVAAISYLTYSFFQGDLGIRSFLALKRQAHSLDQKIALLEAQKAHLEKKTALLGKTISKGCLEEQVRVHLGYVHPEDKVLLNE